MRLTVQAPGHVLLQHRPRGRWLLLGAAVVFAAVAIAGAVELGFRPRPIAVVLGLLLVAGGIAAVRSRIEIELRPDGVRWSRRRPFGMRAVELHCGREVIGAVRMRAVIVPGTLEQRAAPRMSYEVELACRSPLPSTIRLFAHHREDAARQFAFAVCSGANLPLLDVLGDHSELRAPADLAGPPGCRIAVPDGPPPRGVTVVPDPIHGEAVTIARWTGRRIELHVADGELHVARRWFALPLWHRRFAVESIAGVRVQSRAEPQQNESQHLRAGVAVVGPWRTTVFGGELPGEGRRWLRAWLESRLWPELPVAAQRGADSSARGGAGVSGDAATGAVATAVAVSSRAGTT